MDKHHKSQQTSDEETTAAAPPPGPLQARSPYRPLSRRKRQDQVVEPPAAVERPITSSRFDASPTKISAALAKAPGASAEETVLAWGADGPAGSEVEVVEIEIEIEVEIEEAEAEG